MLLLAQQAFPTMRFIFPAVAYIMDFTIIVWAVMISHKWVAFLNKIYSKYKNLSSLNTREVFIWSMSSEYLFILRNISKLLIVLFAEKSILLQHDTVP